MAPRIFRSTHPDLGLPTVDVVTDVLSNPYNVPLSTIALIDPATKQSHTLAAVSQRVRSLAHGLRNLGVRERDVVAFFSPNTIEYAIVCLSIIGCGAVVCPISATLTADELHDQLETSQAKYLVAYSGLMQTAQKAAEATEVKETIQADGEIRYHGRDTAQSMATHCTPSDLFTIPPSEAKTRPAVLCFSSGTTGKAKGAMLSHYNLTSNVRQVTTHLQQPSTSGRTQVAFLPFSHIYGMQTYLFRSLRYGATTVVMQQFTFEAYLGSIQQYRPDRIELVPPVALLLAKNPKVDAYDLSSVRSIMCAAAPLSRELSEALEARFKSSYGTVVRCWQALGMTECAPAVTGTSLHDLDTDRRFTAGDILPSVQMRVVDPEALRDVELEKSGCTKPGEIWVAGPNVFLGYLRNEEASRNAFSIDESGTRWYRSGDIGVIDERGFIQVQDRLKEMIKYKGLQVIPSELEAKLLQHPHVLDCAVLGKYVEAQATELPTAFVVLSAKATSEGSGTAVQEIHRWLNDRVAPYKRLRGGINPVEAIPKSPGGKILRRQLRHALEDPARVAKL